MVQDDVLKSLVEFEVGVFVFSYGEIPSPEYAQKVNSNQKQEGFHLLLERVKSNIYSSKVCLFVQVMYPVYGVLHPFLLTGTQTKNYRKPLLF